MPGIDRRPSGSGGGGSPTGAAGGDLSGTYPNPTVIAAHGSSTVSGTVTAAGTVFTTGNGTDVEPNALGGNTTLAGGDVTRAIGGTPLGFYSYSDAGHVTFRGGLVTISGAAGQASASGGDVLNQGGDVDGSGITGAPYFVVGGSAQMRAGQVTTSTDVVTGGSIEAGGGTWQPGSTPALTGGDINIKGGGKSTGSSDITTGNVIIAPGTPSGAGSVLGSVKIQDSNVVTAIEVKGDGSTGTQLGFYGATPTAQQTGVAITAAAIHAALVNLGLITA